MFRFGHWEPLRVGSCVLRKSPHPLSARPEFLVPQDAASFSCDESLPRQACPGGWCLETKFGGEVCSLSLGHHCFRPSRGWSWQTHVLCAESHAPTPRTHVCREVQCHLGCHSTPQGLCQPSRFPDSELFPPTVRRPALVIYITMTCLFAPHGWRRSFQNCWEKYAHRPDDSTCVQFFPLWPRRI